MINNGDNSRRSTIHYERGMHMKCTSLRKRAYHGADLYCEQCKTDLADDDAWFAVLLEQAKAGNAEAQGLVGKIYMNGSKVVQLDYAQARTWFEKASLQNDGTGLYGMGSFLPIRLLRKRQRMPLKHANMRNVPCSRVARTACD